MEYLDFELPIKELMEQYETCSIVGEESGVDMKLACSQIEDKIIEKKKEIYGNLTPWQRVQLSRHPDTESLTTMFLPVKSAITFNTSLTSTR